MSTLGLFPNQARLVEPEAHLTYSKWHMPTNHTCCTSQPIGNHRYLTRVLSILRRLIITRLMAGAKRRTLTAVNGSGITTRWSPANAGGRALSHRIGGATSGAGHALVVQQTEDESSRHPGAQTQHQSSRAQFLPLSLSHRLLTSPPCSFFHEYERDPSIFLTQLAHPT